MLESIRDQVRQAQVLGRPLRLHGGDTKRFYGEPVRAETELDLRVYSGIVSHEPTELVITARCGTPLSELEAALAEKRQMLAFEPPAFGAAATVGGMVAAGLSGPTRASAGAVRDFVLGAVLMDARGELLNFGGEVMKNVAGYDAARLLAGSLGVLGPIVQVSLKVLPLPAARTTVLMSMDAAQALHCLNAWAGQPLPIAASAWSAGQLMLRLQGAVAAVRAAATRLADSHGAQEQDPAAADRFWADLREHRLPALAAGADLWRVSVPSVAPMLACEEPAVIEWGGALRWIRTTRSPAEIRSIAAAAGGSAARFDRSAVAASGLPGAEQSAAPSLDQVAEPALQPPVLQPQALQPAALQPQVLHPLSPAVLALHRRLKQAFDPKGIFNPGRMHAEF